MVAYNFQKRFATSVKKGAKVQTIRAPRGNGHVKPGQAIQLYTGMRTKDCKKLVNPDPTCKVVFNIDIINHDNIFIDKCPLTHEQIRALAFADGFVDTLSSPGPNAGTINAETHMINFFESRLPALNYSLIYWGQHDLWSGLDYLPQLVAENHDRLINDE